MSDTDTDNIIEKTQLTDSEFSEHLIEQIKVFIEKNTKLNPVLERYCEVLYNVNPEYKPEHHYPPREGYWDENAQLQQGADIPIHIDPRNYPYYYWQQKSWDVSNLETQT